MKSFCLKTNNMQIIDYLLNRIKEINFENLIYSNNRFKIYNNIIIHYKGSNYNKFYEFFSELLEEVVVEFYEEKIIKQLLNYNYFYFDEYEKNKIIRNCFEIIEQKEYIERGLIKKDIIKYIKENNIIVIDGFVYFRLKKYFKYLDELVDNAVNQFVIEKEYKEFISLLRIYVNSRNSQYNMLHLIYMNSESILIDEKRNIVSVSENIYNAKYLSDISFSSNDFTLNTLLTLLPEKIEIHLIGEEDEFINTIKIIFENRVSICRECDICRTYKMLKNRIIKNNN